MKKSIPLMITMALAIFCTVIAVILGMGSYLANTGLDLLLMAKYSMPRWAIGFTVVSIILWLISLVLYLARRINRENKNE